MEMEFSYNGIQELWITETWKGWFEYLKYHISQRSRKMSNFSIKACEGMKHAKMKNGECTSKLFTLHEGVHKNVLPPLSITRFLRLASSTICDIWVLAFLWSKVSKCYIVLCHYNMFSVLTDLKRRSSVKNLCILHGSAFY